MSQSLQDYGVENIPVKLQYGHMVYAISEELSCPHGYLTEI